MESYGRHNHWCTILAWSLQQLADLLSDYNVIVQLFADDLKLYAEISTDIETTHLMVHRSVSMSGQMLGNYKYLLLSVVFYSLIRNASKIYLAHFSSMEHPYQSATVSETLVLLSTSLFLLPHILQKLLQLLTNVST